MLHQETHERRLFLKKGKQLFKGKFSPATFFWIRKNCLKFSELSKEQVSLQFLRASLKTI